MSASISAALPHPPPPARADVADTQVASQLEGLQRTYQADLNQGQSPGALASLAKQIDDAAKTLGLGADLPQSIGPAPTPTPSTGARIDIHA